MAHSPNDDATAVSLSYYCLPHFLILAFPSRCSYLQGFDGPLGTAAELLIPCLRRIFSGKVLPCVRSQSSSYSNGAFMPLLNIEVQTEP